MSKKKTILLIVAILMINTGLRAPITSVGPLVNMIKPDLGLSNSAAGIITTIPLITFGCLSVLIGRISGKIGAGRVMLFGLLCLFFGISIRSFTNSFGLFFGMVLIGVGIAIGNVLSPTIVKEFFPKHIGIMTGAFTSIRAVFTGLSSAICVPIAMSYGWRISLFIWIILTILAILTWLPFVNEKTSSEVSSATKTNLFNQKMTWYITGYMGMQSILFYCFVAWFSVIIQYNGFSPETAGYFNSAYMIISIPGSLFTPIIAERIKNRSMLGVVIGIIYSVGIAAMIFSASLPMLVLATVCCGYCQGATVSYAMALFAFHTDNAKDTSRLSGLAQSIGYFFAAIGPTMVGFVYDILNIWTAPLLILLVIAIILTLLGVVVGKK